VVASAVPYGNSAGSAVVWTVPPVKRTSATSSLSCVVEVVMLSKLMVTPGRSERLVP
jgi:hypothetical protein